MLKTVRSLFYNIITKVKEHKVKWTVFLLLSIFYYYSLPRNLFKEPTSTVIESVEGKLLGAKIAKDMQWRFPEKTTVPKKFKECIVVYEDAHFYNHFGFNPVSMYHAFKQNRRAGKIIRGGSTLTQQVIRLYRKNKKRSYAEKIVELVLATRLELKYSKDKILSLYASHAPFGGNTVGLEAASWRFFGVNSDELSWAESATLAVLPNAPGLIHVNKNRSKLLLKRNGLLLKLLQSKIIDSTTYNLSVAEPLPEKTFRLPEFAPHLLERIVKSQNGKKVSTSIQLDLQIKTNQLVAHYYQLLKQNHINNTAVLVVHIPSRKIIAYVGNTPTDILHQKDVDIVSKPRSTGSILKPFLFASLLNAGKILPHTLVPDVPTNIAGYRPENFNLEYSGAVPANIALSRSLNIPAVHMLMDYGVDKFYNDLQKLKLSDINKGSNHYGLSLILGGAESNLWDLCRAYSNMTSTLNHYNSSQGKYFSNENMDLSYLKEFHPDFEEKKKNFINYDAGSIYATLEALLEVNRPESNENWEFFQNARKIAWKTGTSFGFRDAWAIGITPEYMVGIWVGNADGEGRPELTGIQAAAPLMFDVFELLPQTNWFLKPYDEMEKVLICSKSGYRATDICETTDSMYIPRIGLKTKPCPFHQLIHLDPTENYQVNSTCMSTTQMIHKSWFILPPNQAYYYQLNHPNYKVLPPFRNDCLGFSSNVFDIISPSENENIFLPKDFNENKNSLILKVKHSQSNSKVFWYIDGVYINTTQDLHEIAIHPVKGEHLLTIVDEFGNEKKRKFKIL